jgi:hypothetical protein
MTATINASTSAGIVQTADTSGELALQAAGVTKITVASGGVTATVVTLNTPSGVLATQNGMTGIAKAWVNFNGIGTVAIRDSFNVSSITDSGTGVYAVNFTTAMPNTNYSALFSAGDSGSNQVFITKNNATTALIQVRTFNASSTLVDSDPVYVAIFSS